MLKRRLAEGAKAARRIGRQRRSNEYRRPEERSPALERKVSAGCWFQGRTSKDTIAICAVKDAMSAHGVRIKGCGEFLPAGPLFERYLSGTGSCRIQAIDLIDESGRRACGWPIDSLPVGKLTRRSGRIMGSWEN